MSRNPKIEEILRLWWESEFCAFEAMAKNRERRDDAIRQYIGAEPFTVEQVLDALYGHFREYKKERSKDERLAGGQRTSRIP